MIINIKEDTEIKTNKGNCILEKGDNIKILEDFVNYIKPYEEQNGFMIFKNPSNSESREIVSYYKTGETRAIIFRNNPKDIYVSDISLFHDFIAKEITGKEESRNKYIQLTILKNENSIYGTEENSDILKIQANSWIKNNCKNYKIFSIYGNDTEEIV